MRKYDIFCKSMENLNEGLRLEEPYTIVEQTGIVGLFEICFEQSWKLMKEMLEKHGRFDERTGSPRAVIKIAYQCGMLDDCEGWLDLLDARNLLAHTYSDEQSLNVIKKLKSDYILLFESLQKEIADRWLF